nr:MAG TPA: Major capsid protein [Caudoviricetes sp.]
MAVSNFIQTIWSKKIQDDLEIKCKLVENCLRDYEGDCKYAQSVKILGVGEPTIGTYSSSTDITIEEMSDKGQTLTIDQAKYFAFYVDDVNQAQSVPGLKEKYQEKAVHGLAVQRDSYVASLIKAGTNVTTATALSEDAVKTAIDAAIVALRERNFDEEGVIEITPAVYNVFKNCLITLSTNNPEYIRKGIVGVYDDFQVIMSNNLAKDATGTTKYAYCDVRGRKAIAFAGQINEVEALRAEKRFKDIVRGLDTFGAKVIDDDRIQVVKVPLAAASA